LYLHIHLTTALSAIDAIEGGTVKLAQFITGSNTEEWLYSTANEFGQLTK
jgi:hypothetical protein